MNRRETILHFPFSPILALVLILLFVFAAGPAFSQSANWVHYDANHSLVYSNDDLGNHLIDYSYAGYEGGGIALPTNTPVEATVSPSGGDDTANIQNAINAVGNLAPNANGIRGEVLLDPGTYTVGGTLSIGAGGVILHGSGTNATILRFTSTTNSGTAINISGSSGAKQVSGSSTYTITDSYVPLGATNFHLNSTSGLSAGMGVVVRRPWTTSWIDAIGMSNLWTASGHQNDAERTITAISGNQVTVDIPLPTPIEQEWCTGTVFPYTDSGRVQQSAVENLSMVSTWGLATTGDTNGFGWTGVNFGNAKNCWVRNIAFNGYGVAINTAPDTQSKWITAQDCTYANGVNNGSARPAAFQIEGQMCLFQRLTGLSGFEHMLQTQDEATGPNVFFNCDATGQDFDGGPHRYWAVSLLTDNESGDVGNVHIVIVTGGDDGWGAGYGVFYNCHTSNHTIQCPAVDHHYNWWIGGSGVNNNPATDPGTYDKDGTTVTPASLYLEQLRERLGGAAVENLGYPLFTISAAPAAQSVVAGTNVMFTVNVGDPTLMSNIVALSVSGLPPGATATFSTNAVTGSGTATLAITASSLVAPGSYPLTVTGANAGLDHTAQVTLSVQNPSRTPVMNQVTLAANNLMIAGTNGTDQGSYYVLTSTNLALPLINWTPIATNAFDSNGNFSFATRTSANLPQQFYLIELR